VTISTVLFDADGVLQFAGPLYEHFEQRYGWSAARLHAFFDHVFHERPEYDGGLTGDGDLLAALRAALPEWGWTGSAEAFLRDWLTLGAVPDPAALALVATLRRHGVRCALASNQNAVRARFMDEELGYRELFDERFYSAALGYAKPDPAYFRSVLAVLGAEPGEVLFVDDSEANVDAARGCGLHAELHRLGDRLADQLAAYGLPGLAEGATYRVNS
jgi:putative hydrolase of the HAD superfamily